MENSETCQICGKKYSDEDVHYIVKIDRKKYKDDINSFKDSLGCTRANICKECFNNSIIEIIKPYFR